MTQRCDFCGGPNARWNYPANNFAVAIRVIDEHGNIQGINWNSHSAWLACNACSDLIENQDWSGLVEQSPSIRRIINLDHRAILRESIHELHRNFLIARIGDRQPV